MKFYDVVEVGSHPTLEAPGKGLGIRAIASLSSHSTLYIAFGKQNEKIIKPKNTDNYTLIEIPFNHKPLGTSLAFFDKIYRIILKIWIIFIFISRMLIILRQVDYHVINLHSLMLLPVLPFLGKQKKKIVTFRGSDFDKFKKSRFMKFLATFCTEFHCVSLRHKIYLSQKFDKKVVLINNFVDIDLFKNKLPFPRILQKNIIVIAGLRYVKGVDRSLKTFSELLKLDDGWTLHICGTGPEMKKLITFCNSNELRDSVIFHGVVNREKLSDLAQKSSICLVDSRSEGFPKSMLEAMAAGCYMVHSGQGECSRILKGYGYEYGEFNPAQIALHIFEASQDRSRITLEREQMIKIAEQYSRQSYCAVIERAYRDS